MFRTKVHDPKLENLQKIETNPRLLHFSPKSFAHKFRSFCCCFRSIRLKNKSVKSLGHLTRKLPIVTNQHMMTCFSTQTIRTSFLVILLLFPINMVKKMLRTKLHDPKLENLPKIETNPRLLHFSPKSFAHNFRSFSCCFRSIRLKNKSVKSLDHLTRKVPKVTKPTHDDLFLHPNHPHIILGHFIVVLPSICLKKAQNKSARS